MTPQNDDPLGRAALSPTKSRGIGRRHSMMSVRRRSVKRFPLKPDDPALRGAAYGSLRIAAECGLSVTEVMLAPARVLYVLPSGTVKVEEVGLTSARPALKVRW
jgi:hypothetical protein